MTEKLVADAICEALASWMEVPLHAMAYDDAARAAIRALTAEREANTPNAQGNQPERIESLSAPSPDAAMEAMREALKVAERYIEAVVVNTPDRKKQRNYGEALQIVRAALSQSQPVPEKGGAGHKQKGQQDRLVLALRCGRDAVMESFDYVKSADDQMLADARLRDIDEALASLSDTAKPCASSDSGTIEGELKKAHDDLRAMRAERNKLIDELSYADLRASGGITE